MRNLHLQQAPPGDSEQKALLQESPNHFLGSGNMIFIDLNSQFVSYVLWKLLRSSVTGCAMQNQALGRELSFKRGNHGSCVFSVQLCSAIFPSNALILASKLHLPDAFHFQTFHRYLSKLGEFLSLRNLL